LIFLIINKPKNVRIKQNYSSLLQLSASIIYNFFPICFCSAAPLLPAIEPPLLPTVGQGQGGNVQVQGEDKKKEEAENGLQQAEAPMADETLATIHENGAEKGEGEEEDDGSGSGDQSTIELAWDALELARRICERFASFCFSVKNYRKEKK
jgi:hypothetical protein